MFSFLEFAVHVPWRKVFCSIISLNRNKHKKELLFFQKLELCLSSNTLQMLPNLILWGYFTSTGKISQSFTKRRERGRPGFQHNEFKALILVKGMVLSDISCYRQKMVWGIPCGWGSHCWLLCIVTAVGDSMQLRAVSSDSRVQWAGTQPGGFPREGAGTASGQQCHSWLHLMAGAGAAELVWKSLDWAP